MIKNETIDLDSLKKDLQKDLPDETAANTLKFINFLESKNIKIPMDKYGYPDERKAETYGFVLDKNFF